MKIDEHICFGVFFVLIAVIGVVAIGFAIRSSYADDAFCRSRGMIYTGGGHLRACIAPDGTYRSIAVLRGDR